MALGLVLAQAHELLTDLSVSAMIAAVPSSLAAWAAVSANKAKRNTQTNGSKLSLGMLVEHMNTKLDNHIEDFVHHVTNSSLHAKEQHEYYLHHDGEEVCPDCSTIIP